MLDTVGVIRRVEGTIHTGLYQKRLGRAMYPVVTVEEAKEIALNHDRQPQKQP